MTRSYRCPPGATIALGGAVSLLAATLVAGSAGPVLGNAGAAVATSAAVTAPDSTLDALRHSLSPGRPIESVAAIRYEGEIVMDGQVVGRGEVLAGRSPVRYREVLELAGTSQVATLIGDSAWYEDANGHSRPVSGDELATYVLSHALLFHTYLDREPSGFLRSVESDGLTFTPVPSGAPRRLVLARTGDLLLPVELEQRQQGTSVVTTFEDWGEVSGIRFPFTSVQRTGDPRFDILLVTTDVELLDALPDDAILAPDGRKPDDARVTDAELARDIPLELVGGLPVVRLEVNGRADLWFLIDSGAGASVVATSIAESLGLTFRGTLEARGGGGSEAAAYVDVDSIRLPGVEIAHQTIVAVPLESLGAGLGRPIHGILGWDFLSRFAVELDYSGKRLAVFPSGTYEPRVGAVRVPLRLEANVARVDGTVDGRAGSFLLDTGNASSLFLHSRFVLEAGLLEQAEESGMRITGIGGEETTMGLVVDRLTIGSLTWTEVPAVISRSEEGVLAIDESIGNVGSALLADGAIALDYGEGALWISLSSDSTSSR